MTRQRLLFVSPQFLFPLDAGGNYRTANILRGLKGGAFDIELLSPAAQGQAGAWAREIDAVCDRFATWPEPAQGVAGKLRRVASVASELPVTIAVGRSAAGAALVGRILAEGSFDVAVFDYVHAAVLMPDECKAASVCFTHNVESEILARHGKIERRWLRRLLWRDQHRKMLKFERAALARFDTVIAVSERDALFFRQDFGLPRVVAIPTGVVFDYFQYAPPSDRMADATLVAFTGSMDWRPNADGVAWFIDEVWPKVLAGSPAARFVVVGKNPPEALVARAPSQSVRFTGFVDDVRPHVRGADAYVIPLRIGGGTRIKAFEAMAMGLPTVSTALGVEGLSVEDGRHVLIADDADGFAHRVLTLIGSPQTRGLLASAARRLVEGDFGAARVAREFEQICLEASRRRVRAGPASNAER